MTRLLFLLAMAALLAACGAPPTGGVPSEPATPAAPAPAAADTPVVIDIPLVQGSGAPPVDLGELSVRLEQVAGGFSKPTFITGAGDGSGRLFVVEQLGRVWVVRDGARLGQPFLDISGLVGSSGSEQGLLSVAFHPRYAENGLFFVDYTDRRGGTVLARYRVSADADLADPASAEVLLQVDQPAANHNGGQLAFGPDGYLYVGLGDGGGGGDTYGNGQNLGTLLGTILRLDVDGGGDQGRPYGVPADNPFVGRGDARPEIWAWGLRNPWRFGFDRGTGDLYIADVGQNAVEEVSVQPAGSAGGENYGWNTMEGDTCYTAQGCDQAGLTLPATTYLHSSAEGGCSITGGYVYRGAALPRAAGLYLYSDYCTGNLWALRRQGAGWENRLIGRLGVSPSSFGEDDAGELYVADHAGGVIYRLVVE
ncbi:PQQ-dependent sugar dehydrogenase [Oscillochloris sp. ZM17-4]|uniref:PQQ-dependent sugar dehydrogenase n=1 Tax=Oscillochloris sp. ZM17-4 TaxID=2866714 RepID=UPI001C737C70|nr:PQQ-dependent sugar dehydrogenase [Oscillochloris sp. ZM17-4]MBX0330643.1 PQQ-dependent sugar dehydrogenase [Oscillochloris sp. ZM17-4]